MTAKQVRTSGTPRAEVLRVLAHNLAKSCNYLEGQNRTFITNSSAAQAGGHIHKQQTGDKSGCKSARQQMAGRGQDEQSGAERGRSLGVRGAD